VHDRVLLLTGSRTALVLGRCAHGDNPGDEASGTLGEVDDLEDERQRIPAADTLLALVASDVIEALIVDRGPAACFAG
jgi:hypothetical protein